MWPAPALDGELDALPLSDAGGASIVPSLRRLLDVEVDVIFPIVHGTWGEDGTLQGFCEMLDLPYVGPGVTTSAVAMDKIACKRILAAADLPVVDAEAITRGGWQHDAVADLARLDRLPLPIFVKPSVGGSSVGVVKVTRREDLRGAIEHALCFDERLVVERGVPGREIECAVLGGGAAPLEASVLGEIVPGKEFYDYADKYLDDGARLIAPAELPEAVSENLRALALEAFEAVGGWGMARVDFLLEGETPWINEINTLPGFTAISMYPRLWDLSGVPLPRLVERLVEIAQERHAERQRLDRGIKEWIAAVAEQAG